MHYGNGDIYKGEWQRNSRHGTGEWDLVSKKLRYTGEFRANWPNGKCKIQLPDGSLYDGQVVKAVKQGKGTLTNLDRVVYEGNFDNEEKHGDGVISVQGTSYVFSSEFKEGLPVFQGNKILYVPA